MLAHWRILQKYWHDTLQDLKKIGFTIVKHTFSKIHHCPQSHQNELKMISKGTQNGAKKRLWSHIGAIVTSLSSQRDLEIGSRNLEVASCNLTLPLQELKVGSKPSKNVSNCPKGSKKQPRDTQMSRNHSNSKKRSMVILILKFGLTLMYQRNDKNQNDKIQQ